jgi:hypothetical protein
LQSDVILSVGNKHLNTHNAKCHAECRGATTFSITTHSIMGLFATLSTNDTPLK